jgi:hypothetical protein
MDLRLAHRGRASPHRREYVLPDGVHNLRGFARDPAAADGGAADAAGRGGDRGPGDGDKRPGVPTEQVFCAAHKLHRADHTQYLLIRWLHQKAKTAQSACRSHLHSIQWLSIARLR